MTVADEKFIGLHKLSGVEYGSIENDDKYYSDSSNVMYFILDGVTYAAIEDPTDGYRSCMKDIVVSEHKVTNRFKAQRVLGIQREKDSGWRQDVIDMYDVVTGKRVLSFGTGDADDYYPFFVCEFTPENMVINIGKADDADAPTPPPSAP